MKPNQQTKSGFSLIELAAVVVIIGILVGVIVNVVTGDKDQSTNAVFAAFIKNVPALREKMLLGSPPDYNPVTNQEPLTAYQSTSLTNVELQISGNNLLVTGIPSALTKTGITTLTFNGQQFITGTNSYADDVTLIAAEAK